MTGAQHKYGGASRTTESEPDTGRKADAELCGTGILPVWRRENAARTSNARPSRRSARRVNDRRAAQYGGASRTAESEPDTGRKARWFSAEPPSFRWCLGRLVMATQHYHTAKTLRNFRMSNVKLRPPFPLKLRPPFPLIPSISTDTYTLNACA